MENQGLAAATLAQPDHLHSIPPGSAYNCTHEGMTPRPLDSMVSLLRLLRQKTSSLQMDTKLLWTCLTSHQFWDVTSPPVATEPGTSSRSVDAAKLAVGMGRLEPEGRPPCSEEPNRHLGRSPLHPCETCSQVGCLTSTFWAFFCTVGA